MTERQLQIAATVAVGLMFIMFAAVGMYTQSIPWLFVAAWLGLATAVEITHWNKPRE